MTEDILLEMIGGLEKKMAAMDAKIQELESRQTQIIQITPMPEAPKPVIDPWRGPYYPSWPGQQPIVNWHDTCRSN